MYTASVNAGNMAGRAIWSTAAVAVWALIVVLVFSLVLAERILRPIRRFMEASRKISSGNYDVRVPVGTDDELGLLAGEFNRMATQLGHYHKINIEKIVSEKNKAEAILASIDDGLVIFNTGLKVTSINPAARRMLDLELAEVSTLHCASIFPKSNVCDLIGKTFETGIHPSVPDEQRIINIPKKERYLHYLFSVTAIRGREGILSGVVLLLRDITRLKEVDRLKSEFVMAASHELRTPLTSLGMSVDLLLEHVAQGLAEKDRDLLQAAHEEVHRMKALVNDLLDLSRIEGCRIEMEFERVPVNTLFDQIQTIFKSQMEMKEVSLTVKMAVDDLPCIRADANKITWVLSNLISNALRYVSKGAISNSWHAGSDRRSI
jgi:two-component system, NtrC family, sensor histidine kinase KinB